MSCLAIGIPSPSFFTTMVNTPSTTLALTCTSREENPGRDRSLSASYSKERNLNKHTGTYSSFLRQTHLITTSSPPSPSYTILLINSETYPSILNLFAGQCCFCCFSMSKSSYFVISALTTRCRHSSCLQLDLLLSLRDY